MCTLVALSILSTFALSHLVDSSLFNLASSVQVPRSLDLKQVLIDNSLFAMRYESLRSVLARSRRPLS